LTAFQVKIIQFQAPHVQMQLDGLDHTARPFSRVRMLRRRGVGISYNRLSLIGGRMHDGSQQVIKQKNGVSASSRVQARPVLSAAASIWALLFGVGMLMLGSGLQNTLLGVRANGENFGSAITGLVMSCFFAGFLLGSWLSPRVIQRVGHLRLFAAAVSLASIAILVQSIWVYPLVWALMRVLTGYCQATVLIVSESWLNVQITNEHRGELLSIYNIVTYLGVGGGQLLLNLADPGNTTLFILVSVLLSFAAVPILLSITPQPLQEVPELFSVRELYRASPLGLVGSSMAGLLQGAVFGMGAVYAQEVGMSLGQVSVFMFVLIGGAALFQWPVGMLSDRMDRRRVITGIALVSTVVTLLGIPASASIGSLMVLALFMGTGPMILYSLFVAHTNDYLRPGQMVAASSALVLVFGVGASFGPSLTGILMDLLGPNGWLWVLALGQLGIGGFTLYRMTRREALPVAEQSPYVPDAAQTPALVPAQTQQVVEKEAYDPGTRSSENG
jgi:MFS family permease